ncbi:MAG: hypothetical protein V1901_01530 [Patescibacteria group bacterium]
MSRQTTEKIKKGDYSFEKTGDNYPKNVFRCHFFRVGTDGQKKCGLFGEDSESKVCCSKKEEIIIDYKTCCTKHEGDSPDKYLHCQTYLEKMGNMSDEKRLKLRDVKLAKISIDTSKKILKETLKKPSWKGRIIGIILALIAVFSVLFFQFLSNDCSVWNRFISKTCSLEQESVESEPKLNLNPSFMFYNMGDELDQGILGAQLDKLSKIGIRLSIKNEDLNNIELSFSALEINLSTGRIIFKGSVSGGERVLFPNEEDNLFLGYINPEDLLEDFKNDSSMKIRIILQIKFKYVDSQYEFDRVLTFECSNDLHSIPVSEWRELPTFFPACSLVKID